MDHVSPTLSNIIRETANANPILGSEYSHNSLNTCAGSTNLGRTPVLPYLVIDEKSMIALKTVGFTDSRLRQIFPQCTGPFGGVTVLLMGDSYQLPPDL